MKSSKYTPFILIAPAIIMLSSIIIFPLFWSIFTSLQKMSLLDLMTHNSRFVGLSNYTTLIRDSLFWNAIKNSIIFVSISVIGQVTMGVILAVILYNKIISKYSGIYRALFLIPWIASSVIASYSWIYILDTNLGFLPIISQDSEVLRFLGLARKDWLTNPSLVIYVLSIINIWKGTAFSVLMESAGLNSIPDTVFEAAQVDGATTIQRFFFITLPLLKPFILINLVMTTMITFNVYDIILVITGGGPNHASEVLSLFVYNTGFSKGEIGYGAALSMILLLINLTVTIIYLTFFRRNEEGAQ